MNFEPDTILGESHKVCEKSRFQCASDLFIYFASKAFIYEKRTKVSVKNQTFDSN